VKRLENMGLRVINHADLEILFNEKVLIRAHGEPASTYQIAMKNNLELIDASCPVVLKLQNRIKNSHDKGENIFIYGKHGHAEVVGLKAQTNNEAVIFQDLDELSLENMPKSISLFSQTTKSTDNFYKIKDKLEASGIQVDANDTICRQVSNRDQTLKDFSKKFDIIIFVSGTKSSNGKVLYEVCKSVNPSTYFISKKEELRQEWFSSNQTIGVCGATSTPMWLMEEVRDVLQRL
jgi:4-hydroxy-3-methylbut-2-enyl diphosphate reductase